MILANASTWPEAAVSIAALAVLALAFWLFLRRD